MFEHERTNANALSSASFLVIAEMNSAIDPRIVDIVGDLFQLRVVQDHVRNPRIGQRDGISSTAEDLLDNLSGAITCGCMGRGVARKCWRSDERSVGGIRIGPGIVVRVPGTNSSYGPPADIKIFGFHR